MHEGHRQPVPAVPSRWRLLAHVGPARIDGQAFKWHVAQFDTLRLRLIKVAARVVEMTIRVHSPTSCPAQDILRLALGRIARLGT